MKSAFVIVHVHYDWYRFQENLGAASTLMKARKKAQTIKVPLCNHQLPIIEDERESRECEGPETEHLWIQEITL